MRKLETIITVAALSLTVWYSAPALAPAKFLGEAVLPVPQVVLASFYDEPQLLANGGRYNPHGLTAAHRTLPFGTRVKVTDIATGRSVDVTINDRGPAIWTGRQIDLSLGAAQVLQMQERGVILATLGLPDTR